MKKETCLNCEHWIDNVYALETYTNEYKICNVISNGNDLAESINSSEGISGELVTKYNFGCVLHKPKLQ